MIRGEEFTIGNGGMRLDAAVLEHCPSSTRSLVKDAIGRGEILVNGRKAAKGVKLKGNERVKIICLLESADYLALPDGEPPAPVFEDEYLIAFDKPAGMPVQPLSCRETGTLMNAVSNRYPECRSLGDRPLMAGAVHRIDADTSGLVLVARTADSFECLRRQFSEQTVKKTYLALVEGEVKDGGTVESDLIHDPSLPFCKMVDLERWSARHGRVPRQRAFHALTEFVPIAGTTVENEKRTLLKVTIRTGVTHQIRAQLSSSGMHIINDRLYGAFAVEHQTGHCLHALSAEFNHPASGLPVRISTPLPSWARFARENSAEPQDIVAEFI